ncbi:MAG: hypothetical protein ABJA74_09280 [Lapillicoccus sp.]
MPAETNAATHHMLRVVSVAELVGIVNPLTQPDGTVDTFYTATDGFQGLGVGRHAPAGDVARLAGHMAEAVDGSPMPVVEWPALLRTLGEDLVGALVRVSPTSVRRYASGTRRTPDDVADRLHTVALVVASLNGSYNDVGVRRWFHRPRTALNGNAPADVLGGEWSSDDADVVAVRVLADSLLGAAAG